MAANPSARSGDRAALIIRLLSGGEDERIAVALVDASTVEQLR